VITQLSLWLKLVPVKDLVEIFFFSSVIYYTLLWLKKDTERNLIMGFYSYCALFAIAYYADLPVLRFVLFVSAPCIAALFVILHQETLQKNFIKATKVPRVLQEKTHWVDELIKCSLTALNRHKEIIVVIERADLLKNLVHAPYFIFAELRRDVFDIMLEKHIAGNDYMIWINQQGKIVAINSTWRTQLEETWLSNEVLHLHEWKQQALFISAKTDALLIKINPLTRSFDCIIQGRISEGMNADQIAGFLRKNLISLPAPKEKTTLIKGSSSEKSL
jgi:DNA integrity scanning protein DisA with diadenylate cyclase activity